LKRINSLPLSPVDESEQGQLRSVGGIQAVIDSLEVREAISVARWNRPRVLRGSSKGDTRGCGFLLLIYAVAYFSFFSDVFDGIFMRIYAL